MTGPRIPKVSVIVPTRNRADFLPQLIRIFDSQTLSSKELLILDDSETANTNIEEIAKGREDIHYWHTQNKQSIGSKRNLLCERSTGELIAHFDDDDHYEPEYLERMTNLLAKEDSDLIKLAGWFCYHSHTRKLGYWDTTDQKSGHQIFGGTLMPEPKGEAFSETAYRSFLTGYGFSFLYKKTAWGQTPFQDRDIGEDSTFTEQLLAKSKKVQLVMDQEGLCLHIIHAQNTSRCFPNYALPSFSLKTYFPSYDTGNAAPPKSIQYQWDDSAPNISICTLTHNRHQFLRLLQTCIEAQDYPLKKIEWVVLDDSTNARTSIDLTTDTEVRIKYQRLPKKLKLGAKRNLAHRLCSGDILVYMDDDDYYPPSRVSHAVDTLLKTGLGIAGSSVLPIYFTHDQQLWVSGPFGQNHATAGTFAMTREFATSHFYDNEAECNEEKDFLSEYTLPMAQLDPHQTMICISHNGNTFDKKKMRANGPTAKMQVARLEQKTKDILKPWVSADTNSSQNIRRGNPGENHRVKCREIDIAIPTMWRCQDSFIEAIKSYQKNKLIRKILIYDNDPQRRPKIDWSNLNKVEIFSSKRNIFVNAAWNHCAGIAQAELICIANDDISIGGDLFAEVSSLDWPNIGIIGWAGGESDRLTLDKVYPKLHEPLGKSNPYFGSCMFMKLADYVTIPKQLEVWFGDDYLIHSIGNAYEFRSPDCNGNQATTLKDLGASAHYKIADVLLKDIENAQSILPYLSSAHADGLKAFTLEAYSAN